VYGKIIMDTSTSKSQKSNKLYWLIDYLVLAVYLYYLIVIWKSYPFSIGGSHVFISIIGFMYCLSFLYREFASDFTLLSLILVSFMGLNFVAYIEHTKGLSENVVAGVIIVSIIILISIWWLIQKPLWVERHSVSEKIELIKRVAGFITSIIVIPLIFTVATASVLLVLKNELIVKNHILSLSTISLGWILLSLILILTIKRKIFNNTIPYLIVKRVEINITSIKKWFPTIAIGIFIFGSGFEITRGLWIFWLGSWLAFVLVIVTLWKTWKYVFFKKNDYDIVDIKDNIFIAFPSTSDPRFFLKFVIVGTLVLSTYIFMLFAIWLFWK